MKCIQLYIFNICFLGHLNNQQLLQIQIRKTTTKVYLLQIRREVEIVRIFCDLNFLYKGYLYYIFNHYHYKLITNHRFYH